MAPPPSSTTTSRPTPSRGACPSSPSLRRGRGSGGGRLRGHRSPWDGGRQARPGGEPAVLWPRADGAWSVPTPPSPAPTPPSPPPPSWRPSRGRGAHPRCRGPRGCRRRRRLAALTTDDWLLAHGVHLPTDHPLSGTILHNPRSNLNNGVGYADPRRFAEPGRPGHRRHRRRHARRVPAGVPAAPRVRRDRHPGDGVGLAGGGQGHRPRGRRRPGDLVVRPHRSLARRLHPGRATTPGRGGRRGRGRRRNRHPGRSPPRCGRRPPNRRPGSTPCCSAAEPGRPAGSSLRVTEGGERR